jgi:hypothetical protein
MKLEILRYSHVGVNFLAIIKKGYGIDIACSEKGTGMFSEKDLVTIPSYATKWTKVRAKSLALYTHWPIHTKEFWDLLNET